MLKASLDISVLVPLLNEEESLAELHDWISRVMDEHGFSYEILFVDDGSTDTSWSIIERLSETNPAAKGLRFNKNYGKSAALDTGFRHAQGQVVITMDADLQDSPDEIPELYKMIMEDKYDLVSGWKKKRHDPLSKTIPTKIYNAFTRWFSGIKLHDFNCGLKAYRLDVVKSVEVYGEMHRYIPVIAKAAGYKNIGEKVVQHQARKYGTTKFGGIKRFIRGPLDLLSITFVTRFSKRPMHLFGLLGALSFLSGLFITLWIIGEKIYRLAMDFPPARDVVEQPLFFLALVALIVGVQLFLAGFIAELVTMEAKKKNDYLIREKRGY